MFKGMYVSALIILLGAAGTTVATAYEDEPVDVFEMSVEELTQMVFTSSRQAQDASETAAKVYVITSEMISDSGAQTLGQVLRLVPGFQVKTWLWGFTNTSIRGMVGGSPINERLLWLVDGVPVNDVRDAGIWTDLTVFPLNMIQRIEVMPGPHSSVYGSSAFQGVVSIFTKSPEQVAAGGEYGLSFGRDNTISADAAVTMEGNGTSSVLAVQRLVTDEHRLVSDHSGKEVTWIRGQTRAGNLQVHYGGRSMEMKYPSIFASPYGAYSEHRSEFYGNAQYDWQLRPGATLVFLPSFHHWNDQFWDYGDIPGLQLEQNSYRLSNLVQLRAEIDPKKHLTLAVAAHREVYKGNDFLPDHQDLALNRAESFGEVSLALTNWLKVDLGASAQVGETVATKGTGIHPRVAVLTRLSERLRLRGLYSTAYREPSWWHMFIGTVDGQGNPDLFAEDLTGLELGLEYDLPRGTLNCNVFSQEVEHGILEIYDPTLADPDYLVYGIYGKFIAVQAEGTYEMKGLDLSGDSEFWDGRLKIAASYSYLESKEPDGRATPYDAEHHFNALIQIAPRAAWSLNYGVHYVGETIDADLEFSPIDADQPELGLIGRRPVDSYVIHQAAVVFRPSSALDIKLGVWDFGNNVYEEYLGSAQRGGLWNCSVRYRP